MITTANRSGNEEIFNYRAGDAIEFSSIGLNGAIEAVYEDIVFETVSDRAK